MTKLNPSLLSDGPFPLSKSKLSGSFTQEGRLAARLPPRPLSFHFPLRRTVLPSPVVVGSFQVDREAAEVPEAPLL